MQDSSCPALLGCRKKAWIVFAYVPITLFGGPFHATSANYQIGNFHIFGPTTPESMLSGLGFSAFARRYSQNHWFVFFSFRYWDGSLPWVCSSRPMNSAESDWLSQPGSPIRKSTGQWLLAPYRSLSQLATSFIAFTRQGIHRVPLVAWP